MVASWSLQYRLRRGMARNMDRPLTSTTCRGERGHLVFVTVTDQMGSLIWWMIKWEGLLNCFLNVCCQSYTGRKLCELLFVPVELLPGVQVRDPTVAGDILVCVMATWVTWIWWRWIASAGSAGGWSSWCICPVSLLSPGTHRQPGASRRWRDISWRAGGGAGAWVTWRVSASWPGAPAQDSSR